MWVKINMSNCGSKIKGVYEEDCKFGGIQFLRFCMFIFIIISTFNDIVIEE